MKLPIANQLPLRLITIILSMLMLLPLSSRVSGFWWDSSDEATDRGAGASEGSNQLSTDATNERRVALVIGNNKYLHVGVLKNAVADAKLFSQELETRGFSVVYRENATRRDMNNAIEEFLGKLSTDAIGVVYYSGHGVQLNGANYLLPVDLQADKPSDVDNDGISLGKLLERTSQIQTKFILAVIDACRNNPFRNSGKDIGNSRGLAPPLGDANGVMIVYAAGANQKALDTIDSKDNNPNGLFTREFVQFLRQPGLTVQEVVSKAKLSVIAQAKKVGHVQTPAIYDQSTGTFYFTAPINTQSPSSVEPPKVATVAISDPKDVYKRLPFEPEMVNIPAGSFMMGSPDSEEGRDNDEGPVHQVSVKAFKMGKYEVTQKQWEAVMGNNPSYFKCADCPVETVNWDDVQGFLQKLNAMTGGSYRLPTEAEWEYACRGGAVNELYCGGNNLDAVAWYTNNSGGQLQPVGQKVANGFGLFDMSGNVWEWTCSAYVSSYSGEENQCLSNNHASDTLAVRGGSWFTVPSGLRSANRVGWAASLRFNDRGFRLLQD